MTQSLSEMLHMEEKRWSKGMKNLSSIEQLNDSTEKFKDHRSNMVLALLWHHHSKTQGEILPYRSSVKSVQSGTVMTLHNNSASLFWPIIYSVHKILPLPQNFKFQSSTFHIYGSVLHILSCFLCSALQELQSAEYPVEDWLWTPILR